MTDTPEAAQHDLTELLVLCRQGNKCAEAELFDLVYRKLREMARYQMRHERQGHTLQTTALVNEVYLRLFGGSVDWQNRAHFFSVAAQTMRRILVDHARSRLSNKRSGGMRVELGEAFLIADDQIDKVLAVDQALTRLAAQDARQARIVELHLFAGMSLEETARVLDISKRTVQRDWNFALAWLYDQIRPTNR
ncbi:MAG: sigma-70 family RNA polymerase sigma factor [Paludibaculum sp.]